MREETHGMVAVLHYGQYKRRNWKQVPIHNTGSGYLEERLMVQEMFVLSPHKLTKCFVLCTLTTECQDHCLLLCDQFVDRFPTLIAL